MKDRLSLACASEAPNREIQTFMKPSHSLFLLVGLVLACDRQVGSNPGSPSIDEPSEAVASYSRPEAGEVVAIPERWVSAWDTTANLDSPAFWAGGDQAWVITTAKGTHDLWVHDAGTGELLRRVGSQGTGPGQFKYPNGIAVVGDLLLVIERDNHRVQMLGLPDFEPRGWFGKHELRRPYGVALVTVDTGWDIYVTDDYGNDVDRPDGEAPTGDFTRRVKLFRIEMDGAGTPQGRFVRAFGEADGEGALLVVESIQVDEENDVLLVADEFAFELELYGLDGDYRGRTIAEGLFRHGDPEGIMLYRCGGDGYWVLTDQGERRTVFHILERRTFDHLGSFAGEVTANTDGIWLTQESVPGMGAGALFALHDDGGLAAFAWDDIAGAMGLEAGCSVLGESGGL